MSQRALTHEAVVTSQYLNRNVNSTHMEPECVEICLILEEQAVVETFAPHKKRFYPFEKEFQGS